MSCRRVYKITTESLNHSHDGWKRYESKLDSGFGGVGGVTVCVLWTRSPYAVQACIRSVLFRAPRVAWVRVCACWPLPVIIMVSRALHRLRMARCRMVSVACVRQHFACVSAFILFLLSSFGACFQCLHIPCWCVRCWVNKTE